MIAEQFEMDFMKDIPLMTPSAIVQVIDDAVSYPLPDFTPLLRFSPDRERSLFAAATLDTRRPCPVCSFPTDSEDGLCSIRCRSVAERGRGTMKSAHIYGITHRQIVGADGNGGGRCVMRRNFTMDNQKLESN